MGERGRNCFLRFSAVSCGFLRFPAVFCSFLRLQTTYLTDQGPNLQKSAKIFDKLPFLPFSLSHLALPGSQTGISPELRATCWPILFIFLSMFGAKKTEKTSAQPCYARKSGNSPAPLRKKRLVLTGPNFIHAHHPAPVNTLLGVGAYKGVGV